MPRVRLALTPTPLHPAPNLTRALGGPRILIKRDDLTGVAFGGNKLRNLEFRLARTMAEQPDTVIVGNIRGRGHFIVSGEIHGDGELEGALHLAVTANWHGTVHADQAIIAGKITGGLIVKDKLEIGYTAVIRGRVSARTIAIAKGAIVDGQIEVTSDAPVVEFEEKREGR